MFINPHPPKIPRRGMFLSDVYKEEGVE